MQPVTKTFAITVIELTTPTVNNSSQTKSPSIDKNCPRFIKPACITYSVGERIIYRVFKAKDPLRILWGQTRHSPVFGSRTEILVACRRDPVTDTSRFIYV